MQTTTINLLLQLAADPAAQEAAVAILGLAALGLRYLIGKQPKVADYAQELADLSEAIEPIVRGLEKGFAPGHVKASLAIDQAQAWLAEQGIKGDAKRVLKKHLPALVELAVKRVDPKPKTEDKPMT